MIGMMTRGLIVLGVGVLASSPGVSAAEATATVKAGGDAGCPAVTKIRYVPRAGQAKRMQRGRFSGSNGGPTTDFETIAEIQEVPPDGQWSEILLAKPVRYRFLKYESPLNGWGNVAEVEFWSGDRKVLGTPFGTTGSRDNSGNDFTRALDGSVDTFFDGVGPHDQYAGIDLGPESQAVAPVLDPKPGGYAEPQAVSIACATPGATIRVSRNGGTTTREQGEIYKGPVRVEKGAVLVAVAFTDALAASPLAVGAYRIGEPPVQGRPLRTFHIGNSLTDTVDGWLKPVAESAGKAMDFHRFTIPGAPTDWLWTHPGTGFGDGRYLEAFFALAPVDHLVTQPFAGHNRAIDNEADYSGRFFDACRKHSPDVQPWLYVQWPGPDFKDSWSQGKGAVASLNLTPATTWQEGVANHVAYTEAVRKLMDDTHEGKPVRIIPGGSALALLKTEIDAGRMPGMTDFFKETFSDGIHMTPKGRYLVSLVHYACLFKESPEGKTSPLTSGLTPEQNAIFQKLAWDAVKNYSWAGIVK
jgi:hypothetical protein